MGIEQDSVKVYFNFSRLDYIKIFTKLTARSQKTAKKVTKLFSFSSSGDGSHKNSVYSICNFDVKISTNYSFEKSVRVITP